MAFIPTPQVARVALSYSCLEQTLVNTLWIRSNGGEFDELLLQTLNDNIDAWFTSELAPLMVNTLRLVEINSIAQHSSSAPSISKTVNVVGTRSDQALPTSNTLAISFKTANRGRGGRGRNYIVGLGEGVVTGNFVTTAHANDLLAAYQDLETVLTPNSMEHVVVSFWDNKVQRTQGLVQPVTSYVFADLAIDSQRRRLAGRGT